MKEKNTQNAVVPMKDTRQYKHTPKGIKCLISKIFALVACLTLVVGVFAVPAFATGWQDEIDPTLDPIITAHPVAPDSITFFAGTTGLADFEFSIPQTYPYGTTNNSNGNGTLYYRQGSTIALSTITGINLTDEVLRVSIEPSDTMRPHYSGGGLMYHWGTFPYQRTDEFEALFTPSLAVVATNADCYFKGLIQCTYYDPYTESVEFYHTPYHTTSLGRNQSLSYLVADFLNGFLPDRAIVYGIDITAFPTATPNGDVSTNVWYTACTTTSAIIHPSTDPNTLATETIYRQVINSGDAGDFVTLMTEWVSDLFTTPLFHFGYVPVTIGAVLSVATAVALTFWLLKLFLGG